VTREHLTRAGELVAERLARESHAGPVGPQVVAELMARGHDVCDQAGVGDSALADQEEGSRGAMPREHLQQRGCGGRVRTVVEGERRPRSIRGPRDDDRGG
jgi:hypothetical protein